MPKNPRPHNHDFIQGVKLTFSRTAGCSCGCSAGFVADTGSHIYPSVRFQGEAIENIWVRG